jgi:hypothetical protein
LMEIMLCIHERRRASVTPRRPLGDPSVPRR